MNEVEKAKKILGIDFLGSISVAVESLKIIIDNIKSALGLPQDARPVELQERISRLIAEHEALQGKATKWKAIATKEGEAMGKDEKWYSKGEVVVGIITFIAFNFRDFMDHPICLPS